MSSSPGCHRPFKYPELNDLLFGSEEFAVRVDGVLPLKELWEPDIAVLPSMARSTTFGYGSG